MTTFNTIESVALLTLCPSEQTLIPTSDRSKIRKLGDALAKRPQGWRASTDRLSHRRLRCLNPHWSSGDRSCTRSGELTVREPVTEG